jgi:hypothetical protein
MGWQWFFVYIALLVSIHHLAFFLLELGSFQIIGVTLIKVVVSTLFTGITLLIVQLLFFPSRRSNR